jgi:hypothetical protein
MAKEKKVGFFDKTGLAHTRPYKTNNSQAAASEKNTT